MSPSPPVIYVSYDGAAEPLGRSQVVAYLERLAATFPITLISFEKGPPDPLLGERLESFGVRWRPLRYHKRPPVMSTAWDIAAGAHAISRELRRAPDSILHVRSYVPAEMVLRSRRARRSPLLFDIRGFWVDERHERDLWRPGALYRYAKRRERRFFRRADAIVTLTRSSTPVIESWTAPRDVPIEVVPTCADVERFAGTTLTPAGARLVWMGSVGPQYRLDLACQLSRAAGLPLTVLTRDKAAARAQVGDNGPVEYVRPDDVPRALHAGDVGLCLIGPGFSRVACAPTRFAEFLAAGMPVAITAGIGDLSGIVEKDEVGYVLRDEDRKSLEVAGRALAAMAASPDVQARCRAVAAQRFSLSDAVQRYAGLYGLLAGRVAGPAHRTTAPG